MPLKKMYARLKAGIPSNQTIMTTQIKFGTSGWRAVMAEEFTFENVRRAVHGIARYVKSQKPEGARVIIGRDPAFSRRNFLLHRLGNSEQLRNHAAGNRRRCAHACDLIRSDARESRWRHQLHSLAQSARIQRDQIFHSRRRSRAPRSHPAHRKGNRFRRAVNWRLQVQSYR